MSNPFAARINKEILLGYKNTLFDFFYDEEGKYGQVKVCYIRFKNTDGSFKDQTHVLRIQFTYGGNDKYQFPKDPPNVIFMTPIFHTNISTSGSVCLDTIKDKWSPMFGIEAVFNSIILLMDEPNPNSPFNSDAGSAYKSMKADEYAKETMNYYLKNLKSNELAVSLISAPEFKK
jgi:ubiquitin-protein ligase